MAKAEGIHEMADEQARIGDDFLTQVLRGAKDRKIEIEMLDETYREALHLAAEAGWEEGEALLGVFASGVAYLRAQLRQARITDARTTRAAAMQELAEHCMQLESMYSVLKFRTYGIAKDRHILELQVAGLRPDNEGLRQRIALYREEVASLKAEMQRLQEENRQLQEALNLSSEQQELVRVDPEDDASHRGWFRAVLQWFRADRH